MMKLRNGKFIPDELGHAIPGIGIQLTKDKNLKHMAKQNPETLVKIL